LRSGRRSESIIYTARAHKKKNYTTKPRKKDEQKSETSTDAKEICLKAKDDPKVFCRFVQCKAKIKESIQCIIDDNGEIHTENNCKVELLNAILQCFYK
jgi:hypothetical protein